MFNKTLILFIGLLFCSALLKGQSDRRQNPEAFANFLYSSELYDFAAEEFERLLYQNPDNIDYLKKLIDCYQKTGNHELLLKRLSTQDLEDKGLVEKRIDLLIQTNNASQIPKLSEKFSQLFSPKEMNDIEFRTAVGNREWNKVNDLYKQHSELSKYKGTIEEINKVKFKNPKVAALLSTFIPSSGRFYAKDGKDGFFSLLFIASTGFQSYRRFKEKGIKSAAGWIYGGIALGFYVSNIYGSYQAAKYYNKKLDDKIYEYALPRIIHSN